MAGDRLSRGEDDQTKKKSSSPCKSSTHTGAASESSHQSPATAPIHQKRPIGRGSMAGSKLSHGDDGRSMKKQKATPIPRPHTTEGDSRSCVPTAVSKVQDGGRIFGPDLNYWESSHDFCKIRIRPSLPSSNKLQYSPPEKEVRHGPEPTVGLLGLGRAAAGETQHGVSFSAEETLRIWKDLRAKKVIYTENSFPVTDQ